MNALRLIREGASREGDQVTANDFRTDVNLLVEQGYGRAAAEAHAARWHGQPVSGAEMAPTGPIANMPDATHSVAADVPFKAASLADAAQTAIAEAAGAKPETNGKPKGMVGQPTPGSPYQLQLDRFAVEPETVQNAVRAWAKSRHITVKGRMPARSVVEEFGNALAEWGETAGVKVANKDKFTAKGINAFIKFVQDSSEG
jgi:hypothetical protein